MLARYIYSPYKQLNKMKREYVIWGIEPKNDHETILYTKATDLGQAETAVYMLETRYDCKKCRIQVIDFGTGFKNDFINTINK